MKNHIKAVVLDWAGTSVDYGSQAPVKVFVDVFRERGIEITKADARKFMGIAKKDHTRKILELDHVRKQWNKQYGIEPNETDVDDIFLRLEPKLALVAAEFSEPIPGVLDFVENMRSLGIKVGSSTGYVSSMMENIVPEAIKRGFKPDCIVNSSEVPQGRPFPYMCFLNAIKMNVSPMWHMVKIGDTIVDVEEGINAGMWTIGLTQSGNEVGLSQEEFRALDGSLQTELLEKAEQKLTLAGAHYIADGMWDCLPIIRLIEERINAGEKP